MYIFGAIDHASALARVGKLLGYRVTVCDARARFVTPARFPEADELVVDWPDTFLRGAPVDSRTAICVLTHDEKFDVPAIVAALDTTAAYIGAMGSKVTTADREERLRAEGVATPTSRGSTHRSGSPSAPARPKRSRSRSVRRSSRRPRLRDAQRPPSPASSACCRSPRTT